MRCSALRASCWRCSSEPRWGMWFAVCHSIRQVTSLNRCGLVFSSVRSPGVMLWANPKGKEKLAFIASSLYITGMLVGAAFALYPVVLPARDPRYSLTIYNTAAGNHGLRAGLVWWSFAAVLAVAYFVFIYRMFRGKVQVGEGHY